MSFVPLSSAYGVEDAQALTIGSGRFLRTVLVSSLQYIGVGCVIAQPRGASFVEYMLQRTMGNNNSSSNSNSQQAQTQTQVQHQQQEQEAEQDPSSTAAASAPVGERQRGSVAVAVASGGEPYFEVDVVRESGAVSVPTYAVVATGSLTNESDREVFFGLPRRMKELRFVGVGVTEAGLVPDSPSINDLARLLCELMRAEHDKTISVINTDNVPDNGDTIYKLVKTCSFTVGLRDAGTDTAATDGGEAQADKFMEYLRNHVVFHNTMVDRITSHREGDPNVPRTEPSPKKTLVIEDLAGVLPDVLAGVPGVVIRRQPGELKVDRDLKLRVANGTHTALVYILTLARIESTTVCSRNDVVMSFLDAIVARDISVMVEEQSIPLDDVRNVYLDWRRRLMHPHFGLSTFFIAQNATQKLGIRLMPTILAAARLRGRVSRLLAFAIAALLRFITPVGPQPEAAEDGTRTFVGRMAAGAHMPVDTTSDDVEYASGLHFNLGKGVYQFRDGDGTVPCILAQNSCIACSFLTQPGPAVSAPRINRMSVRDTLATVLQRYDGFDESESAVLRGFVDEIANFYIKLLGVTPPALQLLGAVVAQDHSYADVEDFLFGSETMDDPAAADTGAENGTDGGQAKNHARSSEDSGRWAATLAATTSPTPSHAASSAWRDNRDHSAAGAHASEERLSNESRTALAMSMGSSRTQALMRSTREPSALEPLNAGTSQDDKDTQATSSPRETRSNSCPPVTRLWLRRPDDEKDVPYSEDDEEEEENETDTTEMDEEDEPSDPEEDFLEHGGGTRITIDTTDNRTDHSNAGTADSTDRKPASKTRGGKRTGGSSSRQDVGGTSGTKARRSSEYSDRADSFEEARTTSFLGGDALRRFSSEPGSHRVPPQMLRRRRSLKKRHSASAADSLSSWRKFMSVALNREGVAAAVREEVQNMEVVDLHTHLFPPSHGRLMLWGIDELLTYHYLVAEYFMIAPSDMTPEAFYALPKSRQATIVWKALFLQRSPVSEATRGVLTTLNMLGLEEFVASRSLRDIRRWFDEQDADEYCERVFETARVKYCVMTNIPFDEEEARRWRPERKSYSQRFRSALRVDPLLKGDWPTVAAALRAAGYSETMDGARQYLRDWVATMTPEYFMASTPHDFELPTDLEEKLASSTSTAKEEESEDSGVPSSASDLLVKVLIPLAEEMRLPLALKMGAHRAVNPSLGFAGDGVVVADVGILRRLCSAFPRVKFLVTFLSRVNQHEACVLANKFRNLHLYGCWWYCNNPSIIREMTAMRLEILGTGFTAQHSDARVLCQLLYKWQHSRTVIADVLVNYYDKLHETGWQIARTEIRRDVWRLFGGAYEEFMAR